MSKSELRYLGPTVNITRNIKRVLKENLDKLKIVLKGDPEFANFLVEQLLLVGKDIYWNNIEGLLFEKYPVIDKVGEVEGKKNSLIRNQLLNITYKLSIVIAEGDNWTKKQIDHIRNEEELSHYYTVLANEIEQEVDNIFFSLKNQNVDIMGGIHNIE